MRIHDHYPAPVEREYAFGKYWTAKIVIAVSYGDEPSQRRYLKFEKSGKTKEEAEEKAETEYEKWLVGKDESKIDGPAE